jgi:hypothetical protein
MTDDNLPDVAETIKRLRTENDYFELDEPSRRMQVVDDAIALLESLSARVTQAETELAQAKHDAWEQGHDAGWADGQFSMGAETRPETPNPYPAPVSGIADQKDRNDG